MRNGWIWRRSNRWWPGIEPIWADRLKERGRTGAAVLEYRRALRETRDSVPIMNRLSSSLIGSGPG